MSAVRVREAFASESGDEILPVWLETCPCHQEPMISNGHHRVCAVKRRASMRKAQARYIRTVKGRKANARHEETRIRVQVAGIRASYRVPRERREELRERLATFQADQRKSYKEAASGGFNQAVA